jgi:phage head maturation protease
VSETETTPRLPRDNLFRVNARDVELREAGDGGKATMEGWLIRYNEPAEIDSLYEGHFIERFAPGSMKKTLTERTPKVLFQHGKDSIGKQPIGKALSFDHSDEGVRYQAELYDGVPDLIVSGLRDGAYGISFQFSVLREDVVNTPPRSDDNPDGIKERTVREAAVLEFGPVTFPAYEGSTAAVRSVTDEFFIQRLATQPERLRRLIEWLDSDPAEGSRSTEHDAPDAETDAQEGEAHLEREQDPDTEPEGEVEREQDTAPPEETPEPVSTSPKGRRDNSTGGLVLPRSPKPRKAGVLPHRDNEGEQGWSRIRLP